jgi:hypothetical protein
MTDPQYGGMSEQARFNSWLATILKRLAEAEAKEQEPQNRENTALRFALLGEQDIKLTDAADYLIHDILPKTGLALVYGPPKCGKSFWTYDLVMHVARTIPYRGRDCIGGTVVYVAAEGGGGFTKRIEAYRRKHKHERSQFHLCTARPDLATDAPTIIRDIKAQLGERKPAVIVLDTLNRTLVGSESKDVDMARYLRAAGALEDAFSCLIVVVHHCGVEKGRPRGHTSLTAAADTQIVVERSAAGHVIATLELAKDGPIGAQFVSRLELVELGHDQRGNMMTTCVIVPDDGAAQPKAAKPLCKQSALAKRYLANMILDHGEENSNAPAGIKAVPTATWRQECYGRDLGGDDPDSKRKAFNRVREDLMVREMVGQSNGWNWLAKP